jgi:hypothetical protein|tara:strand:- start:294 stop:734 length:441 start_codon:yes stop_codon:yes gene_type:complete
MSGLINSAGSRSGVIGTTEIDYEEGSYTATMTSASGSFSSFSVNVGRYIVIGKLVWARVEFTVGASGIGTASGDIYFNLPFAVKSQGGSYGVDFVATGSERYATGTLLQGIYLTATTLVRIKSYANANVGPANSYNYVLNMTYERS